MKTALRTFIYSYISLYVTQEVIGGFTFGALYTLNMMIILFGVSLLNIFLPPILNLLGLPKNGVGGLFIGFLMNLVVFYLLTVLIPSFGIEETIMSELLILGVVLPSKSLTKVWSLIFSALLFVLILHFLKWLSTSKKN